MFTYFATCARASRSHFGLDRSFICVSFAAFIDAMQQVFAELCKSHELNFGIYNRIQRNQAVDAVGLLNPNIKAFVKKWVEQVHPDLKVDVSKLRNTLQMVNNPTDQSDDAYIKCLLRQIVVFCLHIRRLKQQDSIKCSAMKKLSEDQQKELQHMLDEVGDGPLEEDGDDEGVRNAATLARSLTEIFAARMPAPEEDVEEEEEEEDEAEEDPRERRLMAQRKSTPIPESRDGLKNAVVFKKPSGKLPAKGMSTPAPKPAKGKSAPAPKPEGKSRPALKVRVGGDAQKSYVQMFDAYSLKCVSYGNCTKKASEHHRAMMEELADWMLSAAKTPTREVCNAKVDELKEVHAEAARAPKRARVEKAAPPEEADDDDDGEEQDAQVLRRPAAVASRPAAPDDDDDEEEQEEEEELEEAKVLRRPAAAARRPAAAAPAPVPEAVVEGDDGDDDDDDEDHALEQEDNEEEHEFEQDHEEEESENGFDEPPPQPLLRRPSLIKSSDAGPADQSFEDLD